MAVRFPETHELAAEPPFELPCTISAQMPEGEVLGVHTSAVQPKETKVQRTLPLETEPLEAGSSCGRVKSDGRCGAARKPWVNIPDDRCSPQLCNVQGHAETIGSYNQSSIVFSPYTRQERRSTGTKDAYQAIRSLIEVEPRTVRAKPPGLQL